MCSWWMGSHSTNTTRRHQLTLSSKSRAFKTNQVTAKEPRPTYSLAYSMLLSTAAACARKFSSACWTSTTCSSAGSCVWRSDRSRPMSNSCCLHWHKWHNQSPSCCEPFTHSAWKSLGQPEHLMGRLPITDSSQISHDPDSSSSNQQLLFLSQISSAFNWAATAPRWSIAMPCTVGSFDWTPRLVSRTEQKTCKQDLGRLR